MNPPLVSILIPCHNGGPYIRATLESALAQTHPKCEVIFVDDGSTDDSLSIARTFEPRIRVFSGPNRGASSARDEATGHACGDWLQYLDADDLLLPHAVASRLQALENSNRDVACGDWRRLVAGRDGNWAKGRLESADFTAYAAEADLAVFKGFWAPPAAILYSREVVRRVGHWHAALPVIQDARFLFDAARQGGRFVHVPGESAQYRQHAAHSLSSTSSARFWRDVLANAREIEAIWREKGLLAGDRRAAVAGAYALGARAAFPLDRGLYRDNLENLQRFPEHPPSRYLEIAARLERLLGYRIARGIVGLLRPAERS
jgi:GT2 family glycosyltransferase